MIASIYLGAGNDIVIANRHLAQALGLDQAIMLGAIHNWCRVNASKSPREAEKYWHYGLPWMYNRISDWDTFFTWRERTYIQNPVLRDLRDRFKLVWSTNAFNTKATDQTLWWTVNIVGFGEFMQRWEDAGRPKANAKNNSAKGREEKAAYDAFAANFERFAAENFTLSQWAEGVRTTDDGCAYYAQWSVRTTDYAHIYNITNNIKQQESPPIPRVEAKQKLSSEQAKVMDEIVTIMAAWRYEDRYVLPSDADERKKLPKEAALAYQPALYNLDEAEQRAMQKKGASAFSRNFKARLLDGTLNATPEDVDVFCRWWVLMTAKILPWQDDKFSLNFYAFMRNRKSAKERQQPTVYEANDTLLPPPSDDDNE